MHVHARFPARSARAACAALMLRTISRWEISELQRTTLGPAAYGGAAADTSLIWIAVWLFSLAGAVTIAANGLVPRARKSPSLGSASALEPVAQAVLARARGVGKHYAARRGAG